MVEQMGKQIVSFETAKLAQEKGFDEPCHNAYTSEEDDVTNESSKIVLQNSIDCTGEEFFTDEDIQAAIDNGYSRTCLAPAEDSLEKWLQEKHNLYFKVDFDVKRVFDSFHRSSAYRIAHVSILRLENADEQFNCISILNSVPLNWWKDKAFEAALKLLK